MRLTQIGHADLRDERRTLALETGNVFATPEFHETWWRHFGGGRALRLYAVHDGDRLAGVWPSYVWRRRPRVERFLGHGGGDELGPVAAAADRAAVAAAVKTEGHVLLAEHLRPAWGRALGAHTVLVERSPTLPVASFAGWDAFLGTRSSNFRQQVRGRTRKLERTYDVRFRLADRDSLDRDLDTLFRLHRSRWPNGSEFSTHESFHRDFARVAHDEGWTRLVTLEVDGSPAAAWYGFRFGPVDSYYQSGRDPSRERDSVGLVLLAHTIQAAFEDGQAEYRFLRGDEPYKFRFTDDEGTVETAFAGRGASALARAAHGARVSRAAARRLARSRLRARRGRASPAGE